MLARFFRWRISGDIGNFFDGDDPACPCPDVLNCPVGGAKCSVRKIINYAAQVSSRGNSQAWNDLDMLEVGNKELTREEEITHFSLWAMAKSPLILGNELSSMTPNMLAIAGNLDLIAVNQDSLHQPAARIESLCSNGDERQVWAGKLSSKRYVVSIINFSANVCGDGALKSGPGLFI